MKRVVLSILQNYQVMCRQHNIQYYTEIVFKHATKRKLIQAADSIANDGYNDELELDTILNDAERRILELSSSRESDGFKDIRDVLGEVYENAEVLDQNSGQTQVYLQDIET